MRAVSSFTVQTYLRKVKNKVLMHFNPFKHLAEVTDEAGLFGQLGDLLV
jgi:hypothetical protein